jgi:hypothetical protein
VKPPAPLEEDRDHLEEEDEPKEVQQGFTVKKFVKVPRHLEESEPEYLAKRRKGLPSQYAAASVATTAQPTPTPLRETKVKKVDSEGNVSVYKALVPEDQKVEGEVEPTDPALASAAPVAAAPGTVVEGVGVVNAAGVVVVNEAAQQTPPRSRKSSSKKKKSKGAKRKKVVFADGSTEQGTPAAGSDLLAVPGTKQENGSVEPSDADTPMADAGEDEEGDEESEDEAEGKSPVPPGTETPSKSPNPPSMDPNPNPNPAPATVPVKEPSPPSAAPVSENPPAPKDPPQLPPIETLQQPTESTQPLETPVEGAKPNRDPSSSPDLPLSAMAHSRQNSLTQIPTISNPEPSSMSAPESSHTAVTTADLAPAIEPATQSAVVPAAEPIAGAPEPAAQPIVTDPQAQPVPEQPPIVTQAPAGAMQINAPSAPDLPRQPGDDSRTSDGEPDLLGSLEAHLDEQSNSLGHQS